MGWGEFIGEIRERGVRMATESRLQPLRLQTTPELIADQIREGIIDGTFAPHRPVGGSRAGPPAAGEPGAGARSMQRLIQEGLLRSEK